MHALLATGLIFSLWWGVALSLGWSGLANNEYVILFLHKGGPRGRAVSFYFEMIPMLATGLILGRIFGHRPAVRLISLLVVGSIAAALNVICIRRQMAAWPVHLYEGRDVSFLQIWIPALLVMMVAGGIGSARRAYVEEGRSKRGPSEE